MAAMLSGVVLVGVFAAVAVASVVLVVALFRVGKRPASDERQAD
jgi:hypothetical protein